jgi:DNA-binding response OmpR family regulator
MQLNSIAAPRLLDPTTPAILKRVLVVDDDVTLLTFCSLTLTHAGYAIDTATDGEQAWEALCATEYDLLLTDNDMPRLTGVELAARLHRAGMTLPVIIASGSLALPDVGEGEPPGPAEVLHKPFTRDELLSAVQHVVPLQQVAPRFTHYLEAAAEAMYPNQPRFAGLNE